MRQKVGHYEVVSELGRGGMGVVYKGFEPSLSRHVAIKLMSEALAHDPQVVERFLREARSMAQLNDPHIIQIYMIGEDAGQPFFAMEYVEGESLSQTLRREGKLDSKRALGIVVQAARGLSTAHDLGVVHRDIKPANLMITPRGLVKVADFGIALATRDFSQKLTGTGEFVGTPGYLSPEVCLGQQVDQRSDVFSLGIVLFEMLAGRMPFTDQSPLGLMLEVVRAEIPDVRSLGADVSQDVINVLNKMLLKDPTLRYGSCHDLIEDIERLAQMPSKPGAVPGVTSASTLPNGVRAPAQATLPRANVVPVGLVAAPVSAQVPAAPISMPPPQFAQPQFQQAAPQQPYAAQTNASRSKMPLAIAAALLIGGTAAGAFYYQSIQDGARPNIVAKASPIGARSQPSIESAAFSLNDAQSKSIAGADAPVMNNADAPAAVDAPIAGGTAPITSANVPIESISNAATPIIAESIPVAAQTKASPTAPAVAIAETLQETGQLRREPLAGLRQASETLNKRDLGPQVASVTPVPKAIPSAPMVPRVLVLALGDLGPASAAEVEIENALMDAGYNVVDEDAFPIIARLRGGSNPSAAVQAARAAGISAIITVRAQRTGSQNITFYGQSDTLTLANLEVKAFDTVSGSAINSFREELQYTGLNASEKGRDAVSTHLGQLASRLSKHRR